MRGEIYLHSKYGVNPSMTACYFCNEPSEILLVGLRVKPFRDAGIDVSPDGQMPRSVGVIDGRPCPKCEDFMKKGVLLISVRDDQEKEIEGANTDRRLPNPYRSGGWVVVKDEFIRKAFSPVELQDQVLKKRFCFIPDKVWDMLGLPRGEKE